MQAHLSSMCLTTWHQLTSPELRHSHVSRRVHSLPWLTRLRPLGANLHHRVLWAGFGWGDGVRRGAEREPEIISLYPEGVGEGASVRGAGSRPQIPILPFLRAPVVAVWWSGCCGSHLAVALEGFVAVSPLANWGQHWPLALVSKLLQIRRRSQVALRLI